MSRLRVIIGGTALALLAAAVPIAVMAYATWDRAVSVEQQRLRDIAGRTLRRADQSYLEALAALKSAEAGAYDPCGTDHIRRMQTLVMTSPSVDQMGYFEGGKLRCTSWGPFLSDVNQPRSDHVTSDGAGIAVDVRPEASGRRQVLSILYGNYDVLVDPRRFVDVIADPNVRLALASPDGRLLARQDGMDPALLEPCCARPVRAWTTTPCTPPRATKSGWRSQPRHVPRLPRPSASRPGCSCRSAFCWPPSVPAW